MKKIFIFLIVLISILVCSTLFVSAYNQPNIIDSDYQTDIESVVDYVYADLDTYDFNLVVLLSQNNYICYVNFDNTDDDTSLKYNVSGDYLDTYNVDLDTKVNYFAYQYIFDADDVSFTSKGSLNNWRSIGLGFGGYSIIPLYSDFSIYENDETLYFDAVGSYVVITTFVLSMIIDIIMDNLNVLIPLGIAILALILGVSLIPRIIYKFF